MTTSTTAAHNVLVSTTSATTNDMSESQAQDVLDALRVLHSVVRDHNGKSLPTFSDCGTSEWETVVVRTMKALIKREAAIKEEAVRAFRTAAQKVCDVFMATAQNDKSEYDALSATLKARLGAFSDSVVIPVGAFISHFSRIDSDCGSEEQVVKKLHDMGYKLVKGANGTCIKLAFVSK